MRSTLLISIGWILVIFGAVITPLPPPFAFGLIMVVAGLSILAANSKPARRRIQLLRHQNPSFSELVSRIDAALPNAVAGIEKRTSPVPLERRQRIQRRSAKSSD